MEHERLLAATREARRLAARTAQLRLEIAETEDEVVRVFEQLAQDHPERAERLLRLAAEARAFAASERGEPPPGQDEAGEP